MLHANFVALFFIEPDLLTSEDCWNTDFFLPFCTRDLDLEPMTFIYRLDPYSLEIYRMCRYELPMLRLSKVII